MSHTGRITTHAQLRNSSKNLHFRIPGTNFEFSQVDIDPEGVGILILPVNR